MWTAWKDITEQAIGLAVAGLFEGMGIPWPGSVIMATAGATTANDWRSFLMLLLIFSAAYTLGSLAQYGLGWLLGPLALGWLSPKNREKVERLFNRYGFGTVCWSRPLAIGNYVSLPAGMLRMNPIRFTIYTFVGAVPWAGTTILAGRLLGSQLAIVEPSLTGWALPTVALLAVGLVAAGVVRLLRRLSFGRPVPGAGSGPS